MEKPPKKLLAPVRDAIRLKHYSIRTEEAYVNWIRRYILFHEQVERSEIPRWIGTGRSIGAASERDRQPRN